jgi:hypothetical protein
MSGFSILDRVVGRIFIYFLLSIIGSSAAELWFTSACLACAQKKSKTMLSENAEIRPNIQLSTLRGAEYRSRVGKSYTIQDEFNFLKRETKWVCLVTSAFILI